MERITAEQSEAYVKGGGQRCPICGSDSIEGDGTVQADGAYAWQPCRCEQCGAIWDDCYNLVAVESRED